MKEIKVEDAVGQILCHDITEIVRGITKGRQIPQRSRYHGGRYS